MAVSWRERGQGSFGYTVMFEPPMTQDPTEANANRRRHPRSDQPLLVQYRFNTVEDFLAEYAVGLSPTGMFIRTGNPSPLGTVLAVQFSLKDGSKLIEGMARVVHVSPAGDPDRTPGMGVEFMQFDDESTALIQQICDQRTTRARR